jgi:hypothetical protein
MHPQHAPNSPENLPPILDCALRAVLLREGSVIPLTPGEIATYDTYSAADGSNDGIVTPPSPSPMFSWERKERPSRPQGEVIQMGEFRSQTFAYAARDGKPVSDGTRRRLSDMVQKMKGSE